MKKYELRFIDHEGKIISGIILGLLNLIQVIEQSAEEIEKRKYKVEFELLEN